MDLITFPLYPFRLPMGARGRTSTSLSSLLLSSGLLLQSQGSKGEKKVGKYPFSSSFPSYLPGWPEEGKKENCCWPNPPAESLRVFFFCHAVMTSPGEIICQWFFLQNCAILKPARMYPYRYFKFFFKNGTHHQYVHGFFWNGKLRWLIRYRKRKTNIQSTS